MEFIHLHLHTEYSLLDGACRVGEIPDAVKALGQSAVAVTDHGVLYGAVDFYRACRKAGIKAIIGCEVYVAPRTMADKKHPVDSDYSHLILLVKNGIGYKNLTKIVSLAFTEGFYQKPRTDMQTLAKYSEGLVCLSACLSGEIPKAILADDMNAAIQAAKKYKDIFKDDFYLELQRHGADGEQKVCLALVRIARMLNIQLVATNDVHYIKKQDSELQRLLAAISTAATLDTLKFAMQGDEYYLKSTDEMMSLFADIPEAVQNTRVIADKCNFDFDFGVMHLPAFYPPEHLTPAEYLRNLCIEGYNRRAHDGSVCKSKEYTDRLTYELGIIDSMGFNEYFLIVHDFVAYAKYRHIPVGPGRGSAVGSLAAYCLGITDVDPIKYGLLFERFLNPERISMPDIDIDFCDERRSEVIDYVAQKYGRDHVAQIITFGTMAARQAVRDTGRALGISYTRTDECAKLIPRQLTINEALETVPELKEICLADPDIAKLIGYAKRLEGRPRNISTHATGVVITDKPVTDYVPLAIGENAPVTQYTMNTVADLGLLKIDFLGLRFLTVIDSAVNMANGRGANIDIKKIDVGDKSTYDMLAKGKSTGLFQLESDGMRSLLARMKPCCFEDIISVISLYRPGPMDSIGRFLAGRADPSTVEYAHPLLKSVLGNTYGCIIYQEQVMQICRVLAGFTYGHADVLRQAMKKKKAEIMDVEKKSFVEGAMQNGVGRQIAEDIFAQMREFARYAFNKSHAAAYAVVAYRTAYLKCHYPAEYMCALLRSVTGDTAKIKQYIDECADMGIKVYPPDVNKSFENFAIENGGIRFGLASIKNVGTAFARNLITERHKRPFASPADFIERTAVYGNVRMLESLIRCGALDGFGIYRSRLMSVLDGAVDSVLKRRSRSYEGQLSLFGESDSADSELQLEYREIDEFPLSVRLADEKYLSGLYLSGHPLDRYRTYITQSGAKNTRQLYEGLTSGTVKERSPISFVGMITKKRDITTKTSGKRMAILIAEDLYGEVEITVFPKYYEKVGALLNIGGIYAFICEARLEDAVSDDERDTVKLIFMSSKALGEGEAALQPRKLFLRVTEQNIGLLKNATDILQKHPGADAVRIYYQSTGKLTALKSGGCNITSELLKQLKALLGDDNVAVKG